MKSFPARRLTVRQRRLRKEYTSLLVGGRHGYVAILNINQQSFAVADRDSRQVVNWYRDMIAVALDALLTKEGVTE